MNYNSLKHSHIIIVLNLFYLFVISYEILSNNYYFPMLADTDFFNDTTINITDTWEDFNITCKEDFYELNNTCLPRCDKFEGNPHTASLTMVISEEVAVSIGVLACLIIIILSMKDYKTM